MNKEALNGFLGFFLLTFSIGLLVLSANSMLIEKVPEMSTFFQDAISLSFVSLILGITTFFIIKYGRASLDTESIKFTIRKSPESLRLIRLKGLSKFIFFVGILSLIVFNLYAKNSDLSGAVIFWLPIIIVVITISSLIVDFVLNRKLLALRNSNATSYLSQTVYPSTEKSVLVENDPVYGGAHLYSFIDSVGFQDGKPVYNFHGIQSIQFVKKHEDGTMTPGVQDEQLIIALLDRAEKLNARFPSAQNSKKIEALEMFLAACKERIDGRMHRGVMGDLKN